MVKNNLLTKICSFEKNILERSFCLKNNLRKDIYNILMDKTKYFSNFEMLFPIALLNLNKIIPKNVKNIICLGDDDLFGVYQALLGKKVSILVSNKEDLAFYDFINKKYKLKLNLYTNKAHLKNLYFDLIYVGNVNTKFKMNKLGKYILIISSDQKSILNFGNTDLYFPLSTISFKYDSNNEFIIDSYFKDIYLLRAK